MRRDSADEPGRRPRCTALGQVLPARTQCKRAKLVGQVSGDAAKVATVVQQYGLERKHVYSYATFDRVRDDPAIEAVYLALPNTLHADYAVRGALADKHVFCEKPMATNVADAKRMIAVWKQMGRLLMVGYRIQYGPHNRHAQLLVRGCEFGAVKVIRQRAPQGVHPALLRGGTEAGVARRRRLRGALRCRLAPAHRGLENV